MHLGQRLPTIVFGVSPHCWLPLPFGKVHLSPIFFTIWPWPWLFLIDLTMDGTNCSCISRIPWLSILCRIRAFNGTQFVVNACLNGCSNLFSLPTLQSLRNVH